VREGASIKMSAEGQIAGVGVGVPTVEGPLSERQTEQYSLAKILLIWALAAAPMGILGWMGWIIAPLLASTFGLDSLGSFVTRLVLLMLGLVWLFVLSMSFLRSPRAIASTRSSNRKRSWRS